MKQIINVSKLCTAGRKIEPHNTTFLFLFIILNYPIKYLYKSRFFCVFFVF